MIFVPFTYFTCLTYYLWKKYRSMDVCVVISGLYTLTSFLALIVYLLDELEGGGILWGFLRSAPELGVVPTLLYCGILTIIIYPFTLIRESRIKTIENKAPWTMMIMSWIMIFQFLLTLYLVVDSTMDILNGDLSTLRASHYNGELSPAELKAQTLPSILQYFLYFRNATVMSLPLFFYYMCFEDKPWWLLTLLFLSSLTMPIAAIQAIDRTEFVFYGLMFLWCFVFFRKYMTKVQKIKLSIALSPVILAAIAYFVVVTVARFDDNRVKENKGAGISALQYAGQGYLNFCYFWEYGNSDNPTIERVLPFTSHVLMNVDSTSERRGERGDREQGFMISVFSTFIGDILIDIGFVGLIVWTLFFFVASCLIIKEKDRTEIDTGELLALYLLSAVPLFGIFYYRYYLYTHTFTILFAAYVYFMSVYTFRFKKSEEE